MNAKYRSRKLNHGSGTEDNEVSKGVQVIDLACVLVSKMQIHGIGLLCSLSERRVCFFADGSIIGVHWRYWCSKSDRLSVCAVLIILAALRDP